jgi:hypothetical protein
MLQIYIFLNFLNQSGETWYLPLTFLVQNAIEENGNITDEHQTAL